MRQTGSRAEPQSSKVTKVRRFCRKFNCEQPGCGAEKLCGIRTANVCSALAELSAKGEVVRDARGYQLKLPLPVSRPMDPNGNGNGKYTLCSSGR